MTLWMLVLEDRCLPTWGPPPHVTEELSGDELDQVIAYPRVLRKAR